MKISSLQENLKVGLSVVSHIAGKNVNLPILNNVLIEAKEGNIKMITTDLEIGVVCMVRGKIEKEGSFTVESKIISDYIALLPNQKVDIELKDKKLNIKSDNYKTIIRGQDADEFPLIPKIERKYFFKAKIEEFKTSLAQVIFAVSTSETRIELSGVLLNFIKEELTMVATDSYRLAEKSLKINSNSEKEIQIIVPAKTLQELLRIISAVKQEDVRDASGEIVFYVSDNQIMFVIGTTELI
ncbi:MAG: DNA polymerase III subunit beta, partial [Candidatus Gastranaerophilaceae bacterium]